MQVSRDPFSFFIKIIKFDPDLFAVKGYSSSLVPYDGDDKKDHQYQQYRNAGQ